MEREFKVGDHVWSAHFGKGVVACIADPTKADYPVGVRWIDRESNSIYAYEYYTLDGQFHTQYPDPEYDIIKEEDEGEMGQIAGVINYDIGKKMAADEEKMSAEDRKFKVGERVWSPYFGGGTVKKNEAPDNFPVEVKWDEDESNQIKRWFNAEDKRDESTIERMEDGAYKRVEDAINPAHYRVKGLPEAIDIINHLMHREQYEGYLWGNIIKYAYRYGRKGDKADTAGKIAWYANQLRELGLCESPVEKKEGEHK
jgi:hypothetical protein